GCEQRAGTADSCRSCGPRADRADLPCRPSHRSPVTAKQGYITPSDRLQTERRITTAGALLSLTGITLTLLQVLQQLGHLDMATHQRRQLTRRRTGVIDSARQHRLHRDQLTRACLRLTHGRKRGLTGHDYLPPKVRKGT